MEIEAVCYEVHGSSRLPPDQIYWGTGSRGFEPVIFAGENRAICIHMERMANEDGFHWMLGDVRKRCNRVHIFDCLRSAGTWVSSGQWVLTVVYIIADCELHRALCFECRDDYTKTPGARVSSLPR